MCRVRLRKIAPQQMRNVLNKERATRLEGSFGVEKEIYGLKRIQARLKETEILMIYFAVHVRNAHIIVQKRKKKEMQNQHQKNAA